MLAGLLYVFVLNPEGSARRSARVLSWLRNPGSHPEWAVQAGQRCPGAAFNQPTDGLIGYLWGDHFRAGHTHQGLDIFGGTEPGVTPVYAAADGYLTRLADWKSTVIIRIPEDPLYPGRQIWTYYTHMADAAGNSLIAGTFPPGTHEVFVKAGDLLGYQGNYSGDPLHPVGVHLHFSIVLDEGDGRYKNELDVRNTLDPSPYFGMPLNAASDDGGVPACEDSASGS